MARRPPCIRVTGHTATPGVLPPERNGDKRPDGRFDVLCGFPSRYAVSYPTQPVGADPLHTCSRCLPAVIDIINDTVLVRIL